MRELDYSDATPTAATPQFRKRLLGYDANAVDDAIARLDLRHRDLEHQSVELREALLEAQHNASETKHDLTRARAELRYWNDRASYVDSEVARARQRANELESGARQRADAIEADAQERSLQLIDRVCGEANTMLQSAREEAREMFLRFETDVDMSHQKLSKLEEVRTEVARTMQNALRQFEDAVRELDKVAPAKRIVEALEAPVRRSVPTFGKKKALDAAKRFEAEVDRTSAAALSTPLTETVLEARVRKVAAANEDSQSQIEPTAATSEPVEPVVVDTAADTTDGSSIETMPLSRRAHAADDEFASLMFQP